MLIGNRRLDWPAIMGVVNVTPDSFSDGGEYVDAARAIEHGLALAAAGADILDIGGEATNPRAKGVSAAEEIARVLPVIEGLRGKTTALLSIDTTKAEVARAAIAAGVHIVNDVSGGRFDDEMFATVAASNAAYVCGHLRGGTLAEVFKNEQAVGWEEVAMELEERLGMMDAGLRERTLVDPGLGFGKGDHMANAELIARCGDLSRRLGRPVLVGPSRKRFIAKMVGSAERDALDAGSVGAGIAAVNAGAHVVRTHEVSLLRNALVVYTEIERARHR
jgi:dihydropteroate synthase